MAIERSPVRIYATTPPPAKKPAQTPETPAAVVEASITYGVWGDCAEIDDLQHFYLMPGTLGEFSTAFADPYSYDAYNGLTTVDEDDVLVIAVYLSLANFSNGAPTVTSPLLTWTVQTYTDSPGAPHSFERMLVATAPVGAGFNFATELITIKSGSTSSGDCFYSMAKLTGIDTSSPVVQVKSVIQNTASASISLTFDSSFDSTSNIGLVFHDMWNVYFENFGGGSPSTAASTWEDIIGTQDDTSDDWVDHGGGYLGPFGAFHKGGDSSTVSFTKNSSLFNQPWFAIGLELRAS